MVAALSGRCVGVGVGVGVGVAEREVVLLLPLVMAGPRCVPIVVGVVAPAGLLVLTVWAPLGVVSRFTLMPDWGVPPWIGVVGRPG